MPEIAEIGRRTAAISASSCMAMFIVVTVLAADCAP
jgi:hypothetical protein